MVIINNKFIPIAEYRQQILIEMANLGLKETGFDHYIWVGSPDPIHGHRIIIVNEPEKIDPKNSVFISISDEPKIVYGKPSPKLSIDDIKWGIDFVKKNKKVLLKHAQKQISDLVLRRQLKFPGKQ